MKLTGKLSSGRNFSKTFFLKTEKTSVVCNTSVFSTLISSDINDIQQLFFGDLTSIKILPKDIWGRNPWIFDSY